MANQLSRTDSSSNQDIRQQFNVKKTIIGVIVLLIGLCHLPEAILLIMDDISLDSILYLIGNILLCLLGIYQLKFRSREMRYLPTKSVVKEKNLFFQPEIPWTIERDDRIREFFQQYQYRERNRRKSSAGCPHVGWQEIRSSEIVTVYPLQLHSSHGYAISAEWQDRRSGEFPGTL